MFIYRDRETKEGICWKFTGFVKMAINMISMIKFFILENRKNYNMTNREQKKRIYYA